MATRPAGKAGSWYKADARRLSAQLEGYLAGVDAAAVGCDELPIPGARIIIAPHAGYEYSGECAAWAYACLDLSTARRVFILGPSHVAYLNHCAVTTYAHYATPFGTLDVDLDIVSELRHTHGIPPLDTRSDAREHSLELHLPFLYKRLEQSSSSVKIVPLVVGSLNAQAEKRLGEILAPWVRDPENAFIISSDFCHWGLDAFDYAPYSPNGTVEDMDTLQPGQRPKAYASIEKTIEAVDLHAIDAVKSGSHDAFRASLRLTKNTVCGRHPIGVILAALEAVREDEDGEGEDEESERYRFKVTKYTTSGKVKNDLPIRDCEGHSVSYVSAYALA
jgi:AmmeMemoRadiSam system protein B